MSMRRRPSLSDLLKRVEAGEDVVIARAGTPVVRLVPVERRTGERPGRGSLKGKILISDDFDKVDDRSSRRSMRQSVNLL